MTTYSISIENEENLVTIILHNKETGNLEKLILSPKDVKDLIDNLRVAVSKLDIGNIDLV